MFREVVGPFGSTGIVDLRTLFVANAGVNVDGAFDGQVDGVGLIAEVDCKRASKA